MKYIITLLVVFTFVVPRMEGKLNGHLKKWVIKSNPIAKEDSPFILGHFDCSIYNSVSIGRLNNSDTLYVTFHEKTIAKGLTTGVIVWKDSAEYEEAKKQCRSSDKKNWGVII